MHGRLWNLTFVVFIFIVLEGCASYAPLGATGCSSLLECTEEPKPLRPTQENLLNLPIPKQKAVVAVYNFDDLTGQRKAHNKWLCSAQPLLKGQIST